MPEVQSSQEKDIVASAITKLQKDHTSNGFVTSVWNFYNARGFITSKQAYAVLGKTTPKALSSLADDLLRQKPPQKTDTYKVSKEEAERYKAIVNDVNVDAAAADLGHRLLLLDGIECTCGWRLAQGTPYLRAQGDIHLQEVTHVST